MLTILVFSAQSCEDEIDPQECCENPDFAFIEASVICPPHTNYQIGWDVTVTNLGKTGAASTVQAWLSQDNILGNGDEAPAGGRITDFMDAEGGTSSFNFGASLTVNVSNYNYLILEIDHNQQTEECDEDNNVIVLEIPRNYPQSLCGLTCSESGYDDIVAQENDMTSDNILATDSSGILFSPGDVFLYKTNLNRFGKMTIVNINASDNYKLTFNGITYNSDGTVYKQENNVVIRGTWSADLDELIEAPASQSGIRDFFWQRVNADTTYVTPLNEAKFKFCNAAADL